MFKILFVMAMIEEALGEDEFWSISSRGEAVPHLTVALQKWSCDVSCWSLSWRVQVHLGATFDCLRGTLGLGALSWNHEEVRS
jgi:hypothetical protein